MLLGVWHTSWTVADLDRSIAFYRDLLGFELVETKHRIGAFIEEVVGFERRRAQDRDPEDTGRSDPAVRPPSRTDRIRHSAAGDRLDLRTCNVGAAHLAVGTDSIHEDLRAAVAGGGDLRLGARSRPVGIKCQFLRLLHA